jgi:hypothetical protein
MLNVVLYQTQVQTKLCLIEIHSDTSYISFYSLINIDFSCLMSAKRFTETKIIIFNKSRNDG